MSQYDKTVDEYLEASGWSSNLFINHAKYIFKELEGKVRLDIGRTVIKIQNLSYTRYFKCYVHYKGLSNEHLTLIDHKKNIKTFHHTDSKEEILTFIKQYLKIA